MSSTENSLQWLAKGIGVEVNTEKVKCMVMSRDQMQEKITTTDGY